MARVITTASGTVTLRTYVSTWKMVRNCPEGTMFKSSLCSQFPTTREEILREFADGIDDRINRHIPGFGQGRRWEQDYQGWMRRVAHDVNTPRLRVYPRDVPEEIRGRLEHRLVQD